MRVLGTIILAAFIALGLAAAPAVQGQVTSTTPMAGQCPGGDRSRCVWEQIGARTDLETDRTPVPGGWLVRIRGPNGYAITFLSDPSGEWKPRELFVLDGGFRTGSFVRLQRVVGDEPQPPINLGTNPGCPCVLIDVRQIVAIEEPGVGEHGRAKVQTLTGAYAVWQTPSEVASFSK